MRHGDGLAAGAVDDREAADVGMPHRHTFQRLVLEAEHLAGDLEHPVEHLLQWEVGGHDVPVDAVVGLAQLGVVVAPVPLLHVVVAFVGAQPLGHHGDLVERLLGERRYEVVVERLDGLGVVGHLLVHRVVRPRRLAEQRGDAFAQGDGFGEQLSVRVHGPAVEQLGELAAPFAVAGVFEERDDVGVRHRDAVAAVVVTGESVAVLGRQAVEVILVHDEHVGDLGDVLVEAHADLDEASHHLAQLLARIGLELVAGTADVALGELEQAGELAGEAGGLVGGGQLADRGGDLRVEGQVDGPRLEPLVGRVPGGADLRVGVDVGHEAGAPHGLGDDRPGVVEREQGGRDGAGRTGLGRCGDDGRGLGERSIGLGGDGLGSGSGVVERHGSDATRAVPPAVPGCRACNGSWPLLAWPSWDR